MTMKLIHFVDRCLEIASPKSGRCHHFGLEHAEVVIGEPTDKIFDNEDQLRQFQARYPGTPAPTVCLSHHLHSCRDSIRLQSDREACQCRSLD
jgi:hypothetical protein